MKKEKEKKKEKKDEVEVEVVKWVRESTQLLSSLSHLYICIRMYVCMYVCTYMYIYVSFLHSKFYILYSFLLKKIIIHTPNIFVIFYYLNEKSKLITQMKK